MAKHAPGPWEIINAEGQFREIYIESEQGWGNLPVATCEARTDEERAAARANATLIAAAPSLLAACKDILIDASILRDSFIDGHLSGGIVADAFIETYILSRLRKVIAEAESSQDAEIDSVDEA